VRGNVIIFVVIIMRESELKGHFYGESGYIRTTFLADTITVLHSDW
jgi:hypothetical protein